MRLFGNWYELLDEKTGRNYYYNSDTKESTWIKPTQEDKNENIQYLEEIQRLQSELNKEKIKLLEKDSEQRDVEIKLKVEVQKLKNQMQQMQSNQFKQKTEQQYIDEIDKLNSKITDLEKTSFHLKPEEEYIKEVEDLNNKLKEQQEINGTLKEENPVAPTAPKKRNSFYSRLSLNTKSKDLPPVPPLAPKINLPIEQKEEKKEEIKNEVIEKEEELPNVHQYFDHLGHIRLYVMENRKPKYLYDQSLSDHEHKVISENWIELYDERTQKKFYYNTKSHKSSWDDPTQIETSNLDVKKVDKRKSFPGPDVKVEKLFKNQRLSHPPNYHQKTQESAPKTDFQKKRAFLASFLGSKEVE
eukprot:gene10978-3685_t